MNTRPRFEASRVAQLGLVLSLAALLVLVLAGPGARWGWWHFRTGFSLLRYAAYGGLAAFVVAAGGAYLTRPAANRRFPLGGFQYAALGLLVAALTAFVPWRWQQVARGAPPIHDVTTDMQNPPQFVAIAPLRADAPNPPEYAGMETASLQRLHYPDVRPLLLPMPAAEAFQRVLDVATAMRWQIVAVDTEAGRLEATDRTRWFGFYDDVVVRVTPVDEARSVVDVRSKSRVGRGDAGANARRIRRFLDQLRP